MPLRPGIDPLGELRLADGDLEVVILPRYGARLHRLRAFGHDLLRTPSDPAVHREEPFFWGGYVMAPWGGRIDARPTPVAGRAIDVSSNFPDGTAIHGQLYVRPWRLAADGMLVARGGGDGWPWPYEASLVAGITGNVLSLDLRLRNLAEDPMPAGLGLHPWFLRPLEVAIPAERVYRSNAVSASEPEALDGRHDLRALRPFPDDLDATWTALSEPALELRWPTLGLAASMRATAPALTFVAASPSSLDAIAIEPQTHGPQAIRRLLTGEPDAPTMLAPGAELALVIDLAVRRETT